MPDRPRVLIVILTFFPARAGLELQAKGLAAALVARGTPVEVLTSRLPHTAREETIDGVPVHRRAARFIRGRSRVPRLARQARFVMAASIWLARHRRRFDVVHVHGLAPYAGFVARVARRVGLATIGKVGSANAGECGVADRRFAETRRRLLGHFDVIVATTAEIADGLARDGVPPRAIARIPNFVDLTRFRPATPREYREMRALWPPTWPARAIVIVSVGRFDDQKDLPTLLRGFARLAVALRDQRRRTASEDLEAVPDVRLALLGDGPRRRRIVKLVSHLGLTRRVWVGESTPSPERYLRGADVFALTSTHEGMPNSLLEAMASGLPVVVTRLGGVREMVDERWAVLAERGDSRAVADALGRVVHNLDAFTAAAREHAVRRASEFELSRIVAEYERLYRQVTVR